jgi:hypothetical protein
LLHTSQWQSGQRILEDLLEPEKLDNREVDCGVETQSSFVWSKGAVELHAVATVDLHFAFVVHPRDLHSIGERFSDGLVRLEVTPSLPSLLA